MKYGDPRNDELHFVYRVFGADDRLLYVGCTRRPWERFGQHRRQSEWWDQAVRVDWIPAGTLFEAHRLERRIITARRPPFNSHHNSQSTRAAEAAAAERAERRQALADRRAALKAAS